MVVQFDEMDVPEDEDGLVAHIVEKFAEEQYHYEGLLSRYQGHQYPDKQLVINAAEAMKDILSKKKDNAALISYVIKKEDELYDRKEQLQNIDSFFINQVSLFDSATQYESDLRVDLDYIAKDEEANTALNTIRLITMVSAGTKYNYRRIPELNGLMALVREKHRIMLEEKKAELLEIVRQCMEEIHTAAADHAAAEKLSDTADAFFTQKKEQIADMEVLALLDGLVPPIWQYKDHICEKIELIRKPKPIQRPAADVHKQEGAANADDPAKKKVVKTIHRQAMFPAKMLTSDEEIDAYVEKVRANMKQLLKGCDGIKLS